MATPPAVNSQPASVDEIVDGEPLGRRIPVFEHPRTGELERHAIIYAFADLLKQGLYVNQCLPHYSSGGGSFLIPVSMVARQMYDPNSRNRSPQQILQAIGEGIHLDAYNGFSQSLKFLSGGFISASKDGRYLSMYFPYWEI